MAGCVCQSTINFCFIFLTFLHEIAGLGLQDNLGNWFNVVMLHMWMVLFRLRNMEDMRTGQSISQFLIDYYFDDVEEGIIKHAVRISHSVHSLAI